MPPTPVSPNGLILPRVTVGDLEKEIAWSESDIIRSLMAFGGNFDPVVRQKGLKIYQEMMEDDQIKAAVELRKQARLSTPWQIVSGKEGDARADEIRDFVEHCLDRMFGTLEDDIYQMYSAIEYGFSLTEKIYEVLEDGPFKGKIGLRALKTREPFNYDFKIDEYGNLIGLIYTGPRPHGSSFPDIGRLPQVGPDPRRMNPNEYGTLRNPFPPEKFVIYSYNMKFGNWYGTSDLLAAFRPWVLKKHVIKFWAIWLERYASPFIVAQYKRDAGLKGPVLKMMDDFLNSLSARSGLRCSDAWTITPVQFQSSSNKVYEEAIEAQNRFIVHALLVPNLLGISQSGGGSGSGGKSTGSMALGKKQFETFIWVLDKMGRDTEETLIGEQVIKQLVDLNYPNVSDEQMPQFQFESMDEDSVETRSRIVTALATGGFINPEEEWVRDFLTLPKKQDDIVLPNPQALNPETGAPIGAEAQAKGIADKGDIERQKLDQQTAKDKAKDRNKEPVKKAEENKEVDRFINNKMRQPTKFERKLRADQLKTSLDKAETQVFNDASAVITEMRDRLIETIRKRGIIRKGDAREVGRLTMNPAPLKKVFKRWLFKLYLDSKLRALEELKEGGVNVYVTRRFEQAFAEIPFEPWTPLEPREAVDYFNRKVSAVIVDAGGQKLLIILATGEMIPYFDQKAFAISGVVRDDILNDAKQIILNGLKRGDEAGTMVDLREMFNKYLDQGMAVDDELLKPYRLRTIVRTNTTDAINQGRTDLYNHPDVGDFVPFWEYSAIIDDRTTAYCLCMNGRKFHRDELLGLQPPAHYNCRSISVPITLFEVRDSETGIEPDEPCPGRMASFSDLKREPIEVKPVERSAPATPTVVPSVSAPSLDAPPAPKSAEDIRSLETLKAELEQLIVRCPYTGCGQNSIRLQRKILNIGEFVCDTCQMPFRVSNRGDLYLFDAGLEKWERQSMGLIPKYFRETE